jgi:ferredoxin-NADP reductase
MIISKTKGQNSNIFILKQRIKETEGVITLKFLPLKGAIFSFEPGQFVLVSFLDNRASGKIRAYSISSCPQDKFLAITVKKLGIFSSALHNLKIGEKIKTSPPQGDFYPRKSMNNLVFLAGGIGIAPFHSIIRNFYLEKSSEKITLFYSNRTKRDIVFFKELNEIARKWSSFKVIYLLTREKLKNKAFQERCRLNAKILKKYLRNLKNKNYFICGPVEFVNDLWKELKKNGVREKSIKTEAFY